MKSKGLYLHRGLYPVLFAALLVADQATKIWAVRRLSVSGPIVLIRGVLEFAYVENRGAAFGILQNRQWFFLLITVVILAGILFVIIRMPQSPRFLPLGLSLTMLGAGAFGNMIDRVRCNYVVDFIYFKLIDFPVFNVADICVTVSAAALVFLFMFYYKEEETRLILGGDAHDETR